MAGRFPWGMASMPVAARRYPRGRRNRSGGSDIVGSAGRTPMPIEPRPDREWLETDGLGGFASGTAAGVRTRRYHALLLASAKPPTERYVLVNGFDATVRTPGETFPISSQAYLPGVVHPDGSGRIATFETEPWPRWTFLLEEGTRVSQEIFAPKET